VPEERLPEKTGSAGIAIPGGRLSIAREDGGEAAAGEAGEIVYRGPNVMLGYAEGPQDLAQGDALGGVLRTGDLGRLDADGFLHVTGRLRRFCKLYGLGINLDDVEGRLRARAPAAVVGNDEKIVVFCEEGDAAEHDALRRELAALYKLNWNAFEFRRVSALPLKPSGKVDYDRLKP
jgi:acyl-CoA synthetase (AMP-forming)/AMP-acid ligase II